MPLVTEQLDETASLAEVIAFVNNLTPFINSLDNTNISATAAIDATKVENGSLITSHGSRHAVGGADPLPKSSVSGAMLQPRCINSHHIGLGAILSSHLADGAVLDSVYLDPAPNDYADGDVPDAPDGYEEGNTIILICGVDFSSAGLPDDAGMRDVVFFCNVGQATVCSCKTEDSETMYKGTISARRLAFK
jgi:hypothetical protein